MDDLYSFISHIPVLGPPPEHVKWVTVCVGSGMEVEAVAVGTGKARRKRDTQEWSKEVEEVVVRKVVRRVREEEDREWGESGRGMWGERR